MIEFLTGFDPVQQAVMATCFTWLVTTSGAAPVLLTPRLNERLFEAMPGFAGGVMVEAGFWSLLAPALEMAQDANGLPT
jgi:ZIP family zinc transporter